MVKDDNGSINTAAAWLRGLTNRTRKGWTYLHNGEYGKIANDVKCAIKWTDELRQKIPYNEVLLTALATAVIISGLRRGLRRYKTATEIPLGHYRDGRRLKGYIISVNDSDNLRFYHQRVFSFGRPNVDKQDFKYETINVRLAGIDAPEMAHFGSAAQPYAVEAKQWLTSYTQGRRASIQIHRLDQYSRAVATVHVRRFWFFSKNVSLAMVEAGFATVYNSAGAEYGGAKEQLMNGEERARRRKIGMWKQSLSDYVSPADHKRQHRNGSGGATSSSASLF
jgi:endonuclease YncB( thermonuclease family)